MYWHRTVAPAGWRPRGAWNSGWHSVGGRSLFFANSVWPSRVSFPRMTSVSQLVSALSIGTTRTAPLRLSQRSGSFRLRLLPVWLLDSSSVSRVWLDYSTTNVIGVALWMLSETGQRRSTSWRKASFSSFVMSASIFTVTVMPPNPEG